MQPLSVALLCACLLPPATNQPPAATLIAPADIPQPLPQLLQVRESWKHASPTLTLRNDPLQHQRGVLIHVDQPRHVAPVQHHRGRRVGCSSSGWVAGKW